VSKNQLITWAALSGFLVGLIRGLLGREPRYVQTSEVDWCYLP